MPSFLVEAYLVQDSAAVADALARARLTAELGKDVSYLRSMFVPADETCLHVFEAPSSAALGEAARLAELGHLRIVEAIETGSGTSARGGTGAPAARVVSPRTGGCR